MATKELSIKLLIDTKTDKLCFAEAGSDFVDFLSGLLSLPLGTVANLLMKERMPGSIGSVLGSMEKLDANYKSKEGRLSPPVGPGVISRLQELLGPNLSNGNLYTCRGREKKKCLPSDTRDSKYTFAYSYSCNCPRASCGYLSFTSGIACHICKGPMNQAMTIAPYGTAYVAAAVPTTYILKDDLSVTRASNVLSDGITLLAQCGVKDISALQEKNVKIGKEEALAILAASLKSNTVLTDVFMPKKKNARCKREPQEVI